MIKGGVGGYIDFMKISSLYDADNLHTNLQEPFVCHELSTTKHRFFQMIILTISNLYVSTRIASVLLMNGGRAVHSPTIATNSLTLYL